MKAPLLICDLCISDGDVVLATGQYTTDEGQTFPACDDHLEQCKGYGFTCCPFQRPGDFKD